MSFLSAETGEHRDSVRRRPSTMVDGRDGGISSPKVRRSAKAKGAWVKVVEELRLAARDQEGKERKQDRRASRSLRRPAPQAERPYASFVDETSVSRNGEHDLRTFILIERSDVNTVLLAWHGSTQGRVTDQPWNRSRAEGDARCAMSGRAIKSGDLVYRPAKLPGKPPAVRDVVLAELIDTQSPVSSTH
jgi:hypothetical protein